MLKFTTQFGEYDLSNLDIPFTVEWPDNSSKFRELERIADYYREHISCTQLAEYSHYRHNNIIFNRDLEEKHEISNWKTDYIKGKLYTFNEFIKLVKITNKNTKNEVRRENQSGESGTEGKRYVKQTIQAASGSRPVGCRISNIRSRARARAIKICGRKF